MKKYIAGVLVVATFIIGSQAAHASFLGDMWHKLKVAISGNHQNLKASVRESEAADLADEATFQPDDNVSSEETFPTAIPPKIERDTTVTRDVPVAPIGIAPIKNTEAKPPVAVKKPESVQPTLPTASELSKSDIKNIQIKLKAQGFLGATPNGAFGPKTTEAVKKFQEANGLEKTGIIDIKTSTALKGGSGTIGGGVGTLPTGLPSEPIDGPLYKQCTITSLAAAPAVITSGATSTISWKAVGCRSVTLEGGVVSTSGSKATGALTATKTFTLVATGSGSAINTQTKTITIVVNQLPTITVTSPNGGELYVDGQQVTVTWSAASIPANATFACELKVYDASNVLLGIITLTGPVPNSGRQWTFNLPVLNSIRSSWPNSPNLKNAMFGNHFKMSVYANNAVSEIARDDSDNFFTIYNPITVTAPNGNEVYTGGQQATVTWTNTSVVAATNVTAFLEVADTTGTGVLGNMYLLRDATGGSAIPVAQGQATFTLPTIAQIAARAGLSTATAGKHFKIALLTDIGPIPNWVWNDASDSFFTIN